MKSWTSVFALGLLLLAACGPDADLARDSRPEHAEKPAAVAPPFSGWDLPYRQFSFEGSQAQSLSLDNGSRIEIPALAFADAAGRPVEGLVTLSYREFHDAADILASGITMHMTTAEGESGYLISAGMFDIKAEAGGQAIDLAEGRSITVSVASDVPGEGYDFLELDRTAANWRYRGPAVPQPNPARKTLAASTATPPAKPRAFDPAKPVLNFDINYKHFPELRQMQGIIWQYAGQDPAQDPAQQPWVLKETWEFAELSAQNPDGSYPLELRNSRRSFRTQVAPCRAGEDFEAAMRAYQSALSAYSASAEAANDREGFAQQQKALLRSFAIMRMGIYNFDALMKASDCLVVQAELHYDQPVAYAQQIPCYLVIGNGRGVIRMGGNGFDKLYLPKDEDFAFISVLPGNKVAVCAKSDCRKVRDAIAGSGAQNADFQLRVLEGSIGSAEQLREMMNKAVL